jgi:hypothetical protein
MFRTAGRTVARSSGRFARSEARRHLSFSTSSSNASAEAKSRSYSTLAAGVIAASTALAVGAYVGSKQIVYNDAAENTPAAVLPDEKRNGRMVSGTAEALEDDGHLNTLVWGSNKYVGFHSRISSNGLINNAEQIQPTLTRRPIHRHFPDSMCCAVASGRRTARFGIARTAWCVRGREG